MKIFCIGRNYADHAKELKNDLPTEPVVFMKPATAVIKDGKPFYLPDLGSSIHYELELVLRIGKNGKSIDLPFADSYIESIGLGIDFTARDLQDKLKGKGLPWELAKAFDGSAILGDFVPYNSGEPFIFHLEKNKEKVQDGNSKDLIFKFDFLVQYLSKYFTLQKGDLIFTGTPAGVGPVKIGDVLEGYMASNRFLKCEIK
jgi:2-keto-4-pentenoate hydratase/2-oxohepta-3-ene-1,7-dioic acid hydratase in catechol pathway